MRQSEVTEIYRFFYNESNRLDNLFIIKWNNIFSTRRFDTLDLLDLIELTVQDEYLSYLQKRVQTLVEYMKDYC